MGKSEYCFRSTIKFSPVPYAILDEAYAFTYVNSAFINTFGYLQDDIPTLDAWWLKAYPDPVSRELAVKKCQSRLEEASKTGEPFYSIATCVRCKDESNRTILLEIALLKDLPSRQYLVTFNDVTQQKNTAQHLAALWENATDGIHVLDDDGNIVECSQSFAHMLGYTYEEVVKLNVSDWDVQSGRGNLVIAFRSKIKSPAMFETKYRRKDGSLFDVEVYTKGITLDNRSCLYVSSRNITERKMSEQVIRELKDQYERLFADSPDAYFILELEGGRICDCNGAAEIMLHGSRGQIIGLTPEQILPPIQPDGRSSQEVAAKMIAKIQCRERDRFEWLLRRFDGSTLRAEVSMSLSTYQGRPVHFIACRDITDRIKAEKALRKSESRFRILYESTPAMLHSIDRQARLLSVSNTWLETLGYAREEVIGHNLTEFMTEQSRLFANESVLPDFFQTGSCSNIPYQMVTKDGRIRDILLSAISECDSTGAILRSFAVLQDVTQHNLDQRRIDQLVEEQKAILETELVGIATVQDRKFLWVNPALERMFGYDTGELTGCSARCIYPNGEAYRALGEAAYPLLRSGRIYRTQTEFRHKNGTALWLDISGSMLHAQSSKSVWALTDLTELRQAELKLKAAKEAAETANCTKSAFLANMSHEIRTPMNAVMGLTQLLLDSELSVRQRDYMTKLNISAKSLLGILNDILDYSKIEAGRLQLESVEFELEEVLDTISDLFSISAEEKGIELIFDVAPNIPPVLVGDPLRFKQIINNLLGNAIKFTTSGHVCLSMKAISQQSDDILLEVTVLDTGIGMSPEQIGKLFTAFEQADISTTRKYGGSGLGLAIARHLVELMDGTISVESAPGRGSSFTLSLVMKVSRTPLKKRSAANLRGMRTLVVEDHEIAREALATILNSWQFDVEVAGTGESALEMMHAAAQKNQPYELVLLDWRLPGIDGIELARRINVVAVPEPADIPQAVVIMVTAFGRKEAQDAARDVRFDAILDKPIMASQLYDTIAGLQGAGPHETSMECWGVLRANRVRLQAVHGARILLVEDNPTNQMIAKELLEKMGLVVAIANNGLEAVTQAASQTFDLILMDLQMPEMDGLEATRRIRALPQGRAIPIVAMTAAALLADREASHLVGMNGFVAKPIDMEQLTVALLRLIRPPEDRDRANAPSPEAKPYSSGESFTVPGLNIPEAIARLRNNWNLLRSVLLGFRRDFAGSAVELERQLLERRWHDAQRLVHTIKGMAKSIGADELHEIAKQLEGELKAEDCRSKKQFQASLAQTLTVLSELQEEPPTSKAVIAPQHLKELIDEILGITARSGWLEPELLEELRRHLSTPEQLALFGLLRAQTQRFDYVAAKASLLALADQCEITTGKP